MNLSEYDGKYVHIKDIYGDTYTGRAEYEDRDFLELEYYIRMEGLIKETTEFPGNPKHPDTQRMCRLKNNKQIRK